MTPLNVFSVFAGIGGLELGLERAGMTVVGQVEIDPYCQRVLAKHWRQPTCKHEDSALMPVKQRAIAMMRVRCRPSGPAGAGHTERALTPASPEAVLNDNTVRGKAPKTCAVATCGRPARSRGWCTMHYSKWQRNGDPLGGLTPKGAARAWLVDAVADRDRGECWPWPFAASLGYGHFVHEGRSWKATHAALIFDGQPRPAAPNNNALHSCDNPPCVNPAHLRWGSLLDNSGDQRERDRLPQGQRGGQTKLTDAQVLEIYARWVPGKRGNASTLAAEYGVTRSAIRFIGIGQSWTWLTRPDGRSRDAA